MFHFLASDLCSSTTCQPYSTCITTPDRQTQCICRQCEDAYSMICASDLKTYASQCYLQRYICFTQENITLEKQEACGKIGNFVFFIYFFKSCQRLLFLLLYTLISCVIQSLAGSSSRNLRHFYYHYYYHYYYYNYVFHYICTSVVELPSNGSSPIS